MVAVPAGNTSVQVGRAIVNSREPCGGAPRAGSVHHMRNVWKGLFVGALAGAAAGLAVDILYGAGGGLAAVTREAGRRAPDAVDWAVAVTTEARRRLRHADLPDQVRVLAQGIADSDFRRQLVDATSDATATGRRAVRGTLKAVREVAR